MILLDSDIVIYSTKEGNDTLRRFLADRSLGVSIVTYVEVLGFHQITKNDKTELEEFFEITKVIPMSAEIAETAVSLKQSRKMKLGDSLIAATALVEGCKLLTNNVRDFNWIDALTLINPFEDQ